MFCDAAQRMGGRQGFARHGGRHCHPGRINGPAVVETADRQGSVVPDLRVHPEVRVDAVGHGVDVVQGIDAHVADLYDLGFPDESFDAAWAMSGLGIG